MNPNASADAADQQLNNNLQLLNSELYSLIDYKESQAAKSSSCPKSAACGVLQEINHKLHELKLDADAPEFEFHGFGCTQTMAMLPKRLHRFNEGGAIKKSKSNIADNNGNQIVSRQKQKQLQKENMWNKEKCNALNIEKRCSLNLTGNCIEQYCGQRLIELFRSLHYHISADLPSSQLNSVPSDYVFQVTRKCSMPNGFNFRHHVQVLSTKLERFLARLRRLLETNRHFDYIKYTECDTLLTGAFHDLRSLRKFTNIELRHRSMQFITQTAKYNARTLEELLLELRERLKSAHIHVHAFNWEMDLEHRYSAAMTARHEATINGALALAASEVLAAKAHQISKEEQFIAEHYQLANFVSCAKEHEDFLNALLQSPDTYFLPEIIALCDPPKDISKLSAYQLGNVDEDSVENMVFGGDILELPPSSPPRLRRRAHIPRCNRA
ncbi:protein bag-of-marbles [Drosophila innubila]|uniref:protein bag-of-marbles n=1 Tax=Drosophila innubila TaxID=198719 RepID=UPI00148C83EC|nr:protein bag-of-marbles [Drosophila innubila]